MPKAKSFVRMSATVLAALMLSQCAALPAFAPSDTESAALTAIPESYSQPPAESPGRSVPPASQSAALTGPSTGPASLPADPVLEIMEGMSDEELLGQMVMLGFSGQDVMPGEVAKLYEQYKVGSVMLFGWNVKSAGQTASLVKKLNAMNPYPRLPLLIGIDEEGGSVSRLPWRPRTRSAAELGRRGDAREAYSQYLRVGKKLHEIGININFAPVLDIAPDPSKTFMGQRMFGGDPEKAIPLMVAAIRGTHDGGVFSLGKHFPGHGETAVDSHKALPMIGVSRERLREYALKPFAAAIDAGVDAMIVGHLLVNAVDEERPASLSRKAIAGLLRGEMGFRGVVFSDDMRMGAIVNNYDIGEACVLFVEAGGDVAFIGKYPDMQAKALKALAEAVRSGRITRERLLESAYRIVTLKLKIKRGFEKQQP